MNRVQQQSSTWLLYRVIHVTIMKTFHNYLIMSFLSPTCLHLSMKQGSLFCFVMLRYPKPWCLRLCSCYLQKSSLNRDALALFEIVWNYGVEVTNYWTISQWKLNKIEIEIFIGIWKALNKSNLIDFISQFLELREKFLNFVSKFKRNAKIGFGRKNQLSF
jgi:hypothetical protein